MFPRAGRLLLGKTGDYGVVHLLQFPPLPMPLPPMSLDRGDRYRKELSHLFSLLSSLAEQGQAWTLDLPIYLFPTSSVTV